MQKVCEDGFPFTFDFTGHDADAVAKKFLDLGLLVAQHIDGAAGMEAAHDHRDVFRAKQPRHVDGTGKLVGLHTDHAHQQFSARLLAPADNLFDRHFFGGFIEGGDFDVELAEQPALFDILGQAMQDVERVARQHAFPKTNQVAVIVILGRLDQNDMKFLALLQHRTHRLPNACKCLAHLL